MKIEIIDTLEFPRQITRGHVPLEICEHAGNFSPSDCGRLVCETRVECE